MPVVVRRKAPNSPPIDVRRIVRMCRLMLDSLGLPRAELSVLLTDDAGIRELNATHRQKDRATDVLSFPQHDGWPDTTAPVILLGDIVISLDTAERQAQSRKRPLLAEVRWLLAHGLLHLVGHDHATPEEKRLMVAATRKLVQSSPLPTDRD